VCHYTATVANGYKRIVVYLLDVLNSFLISLQHNIYSTLISKPT